MSIFEKISAAFRSVDTSLRLANAAALAYHVGTGNSSETYVEFGVERPLDVAMNLAGAYAADGAANVLAAFRSGGNVDEVTYEAALRSLASGDLTGEERYMARVLANVSWRAGQPFRGLKRLERPVMDQWNLLTDEEKIKDDVQIAAAAKALLVIIEETSDQKENHEIYGGLAPRAASGFEPLP